MIPQNFEYSAPATLQEALALLARWQRQGAGRRHEPDPADEAAAGRAGAPGGPGPHAGPELHPRGRRTAFTSAPRPRTTRSNRRRCCARTCPLLAETASHIGDVQVRNMGTIGGSVAHADPAADYPAALLALEAQVRLASASGERTLSFGDFLVDTFTTALEPGEIVREMIVPVESRGAGVSYQKMDQPASGFAIVGVAVRVGSARTAASDSCASASPAWRPKRTAPRTWRASCKSDAATSKRPPPWWPMAWTPTPI